MFRLKTPSVSAHQLTRDITGEPDWMAAARSRGAVGPFEGPVGEGGTVYVSGIEGRRLRADPGDWIVQAADGVLTAVSPTAFAAAYEPADG